MVKNHRFRIAVRGVLLDHLGRFLILRRAKEARGEKGYWELPGGGLDFGETPQDALKREVFEETHLSCRITEPLVVWNHHREDQVQIIGMTFSCDLPEGDIVLSHEHDDYAWVTLDTLKDYKVFPELLEEASGFWCIVEAHRSIHHDVGDF
jgi:8-oxo-dGTP diphosphatase